MTKMTFIGDIHGAIKFYERTIAEAEKSIQVGDFGYGWLTPDEESHMDDIMGTDHKFIRGNHDSPELAKRAKGYIEDGFFDDETNMMLIGGAFSIDADVRTAGINWWWDEQCSSYTFQRLLDKYEAVKPKIMVTHDGPEDITFAAFIENTPWPLIETTTGMFLQQMLNKHRPDIWIFGHWHTPFDKVIDGTRFVCLNINETLELEV